MKMRLPGTKQSVSGGVPPPLFLEELKDRSRWFVFLRLIVPPGILIAAGIAHLLGYRFHIPAILLIAGMIFAYNLVFLLWIRRMSPGQWQSPEGIGKFTYWQLGADYGALLLLIYFTGGAASPVLFFFIFHIILAAMLLPRIYAYIFAIAVAAGVFLINLAKNLGWAPLHQVYYGAEPVLMPWQTPLFMPHLLFFTASLLITAFLATTIMRLFYLRVRELDAQTDNLAAYNERFTTLFSLVEAMGAFRQLDPVLEVATRELASVMGVRAISVKLLSEDGVWLVYRGNFGLPETFVQKKSVEVKKSPLNQRIIEGEAFVTGDVSRPEMFQFGEDLAAARIRSVLFVPMVVEQKTIGVLGAYCRIPGRFSRNDISFFRLAAGLVAIAIENSRSYEAIENFTAERSRFMLRVAHNLRAPLGAVLGMLELLREEHMGSLTAEQAEYLRRVDRRTRTMLDMINQLMTLATSRTTLRQPEKTSLDVYWLAGRVERTFQSMAAERNIDFAVRASDGVPPVSGNADQIEQVLENLGSNAIKYTPEGGRVRILFSSPSANKIMITVTDTGIGIAENDLSQLFSEFFRADNAREKEELGTGLGLAIAREIVESHQGRITVESREGRGTTFAVTLPAAGGDKGNTHAGK